jgi:hypothetical protein
LSGPAASAIPRPILVRLTPKVIAAGKRVQQTVQHPIPQPDEIPPMIAFRVLLVSIVVVVLVYTGLVGATQGWNFLPIFFLDIFATNWPGQFNLDFSCLLLLSGLWLAWRHQYSSLGIALGLLALVGGSPLLCTYLFITSIAAKGDVKVLLLGRKRADA